MPTRRGSPPPCERPGRGSPRAATRRRERCPGCRSTRARTCCRSSRRSHGSTRASPRRTAARSGPPDDVHPAPRAFPTRRNGVSAIDEPRPVASAAPTGSAPPPHDEYRPDPDRWMALAVVLAAQFMPLVNVALPSIEQGLHTQPNELQWIVAGYALALGLLLVPAGRFGDAHGRRPVFMVGVALFVVASAACALAPTSLALVLLRIVQGFAGGLISPQISGLIQSLFRSEERGRAFGLFGSTIAVSTAVGPLTGGALIALFGAHDGWRAVFFVNLPIGA